MTYGFNNRREWAGCPAKLQRHCMILRPILKRKSLLDHPCGIWGGYDFNEQEGLAEAMMPCEPHELSFRIMDRDIGLKISSAEPGKDRCHGMLLRMGTSDVSDYVQIHHYLVAFYRPICTKPGNVVRAPESVKRGEGRLYN